MYEGKQFWNGKSHNRYDPNFINERENYYNKPVVSLNWFSQLSESALLSTVAYYSGGEGGGSGFADVSEMNRIRKLRRKNDTPHGQQP